MRFGSHLYGTNSPTSDTDYKGIYLPTKEEYYLQTVKKSINKNQKNSDSLKNTSIDIDEEYYSLNYFIKLAIDGDTTAIDMLHAPDKWEDISSPIWEDLKSKRHLFYSKNVKSYVGYARSQAAKYSLKGSRLDTAGKIVEWCDKIIASRKVTEDMTFQAYLNHIHFHDTHAKPENVPGVYNSYKEAISTGKANTKGTKILHYIKDLPVLEYTKITYSYTEDNSIDLQKSYYEVFDKKFGLNDYVESLRNSMFHFYTSFGERAELARKNESIDWKAIHHAFRASLQLKEIYETGDLKYPLKDAQFLKDIKYAKYHYINDGIGTQLDNLVDDIKRLSDNSYFPSTPCEGFWNDWLVDTLIDNL